MHAAGSGGAPPVGSTAPGWQGFHFAAAAADGVTVDDESVGQVLGVGAPILGALRPLQRMTNECAVAVIHAGSAIATACAHQPFLAPASDELGLPRPRGCLQPQPNSCSRSSSMPK
jgi:hypothetical protein